MQLDKKALLRWALDHIVWFILLIILLGLSFSIKGFGQWAIYRNIFYHAVFVGVLAVGAAIVIISKEMDLSVESVAGLAAIMTAWLTGLGSNASGYLVNGYLTLVLMLVMGGGIGFFNGFIICKFRISSFIVTLAGYLMFRAIALVVTSGRGIIRLRPEVIAVARTEFFSIPAMVLILILVYIVFYMLLTLTRFGQHIYIVGDNREAAYNAGIRVDRVVVGAFILSGTLAGLTGWLLAARTNGAAPNIGIGMLFEAFAAVVIGGVSLRGGIGNLTGVFAGALLLSTITTAVNVLGMPVFYMNIIRGALILVAVMLDSIIRRIRPYLL